MRGGRWSAYWGARAVLRSLVFSGRSPRAEAADYAGLLILFWVVAVALLLALATFDAMPDAPLGPMPMGLLLYALALIPTLGLLARRLNDQGRSRWWMLTWPLALAWPLLAAAAAAETGAGLPWIAGQGLEIVSRIAPLPLLFLLGAPGAKNEKRHGFPFANG